MSEIIRKIGNVLSYGAFAASLALAPVNMSYAAPKAGGANLTMNADAGATAGDAGVSPVVAAPGATADDAGVAPAVAAPAPAGDAGVPAPVVPAVDAGVPAPVVPAADAGVPAPAPAPVTPAADAGSAPVAPADAAVAAPVVARPGVLTVNCPEIGKDYEIGADGGLTGKCVPKPAPAKPGKGHCADAFGKDKVGACLSDSLATALGLSDAAVKSGYCPGKSTAAGNSNRCYDITSVVNLGETAADLRIQLTALETSMGEKLNEEAVLGLLEDYVSSDALSKALGEATAGLATSDALAQALEDATAELATSDALADAKKAAEDADAARKGEITDLVGVVQRLSDDWAVGVFVAPQYEVGNDNASMSVGGEISYRLIRLRGSVAVDSDGATGNRPYEHPARSTEVASDVADYTRVASETGNVAAILENKGAAGVDLVVYDGKVWEADLFADVLFQRGEAAQSRERTSYLADADGNQIGESRTVSGSEPTRYNDFRTVVVGLGGRVSLGPLQIGVKAGYEVNPADTNGAPYISGRDTGRFSLDRFVVGGTVGVDMVDLVKSLK